MTDLQGQVLAILKRYGVRKHEMATKATWRQVTSCGRGVHTTLYAVWCEGKQITDPCSHPVAMAQRDVLTTGAIIELFALREREAPVRVAGAADAECRRVAQPDWQRLGLGSAEEAEGRN